MTYTKTVLQCCLWLSVGVANAQLTIVSDDFTGEPQYIDNSKSIIWAGYTTPESAFEVKDKTDNAGLTYPALQLTDTARAYTNYNTLANSTKALTCIDYHFGVFDRTEDTLWVEFDVLWEKITNSGEAGRINAILLHEYPQGGAKFGEVDSIHSGNHPFGRPAYHFRVRNRNPALGNGYGFMGYGGNNDTLGKLYVYSSGGVPKHWLPGAVPVSGSFPPAFPAGGAVDLLSVASATEWRRIIWTITPELITVSWKKSGSSNTPAIISSLPTPLSSDAPHYNYFKEVEAFRLYLYGAGENIFVANMKITGTAMPALTTALPAPATQGFNYYPNPAKDYLHIATDESDALISIVTPEGKSLLTTSLKAAKHSVFVGDLIPGLYFIIMKSPKQHLVKKFIKE